MLTQNGFITTGQYVVDNKVKCDAVELQKRSQQAQASVFEAAHTAQLLALSRHSEAN